MVIIVKRHLKCFASECSIKSHMSVKQNLDNTVFYGLPSKMAIILLVVPNALEIKTCETSKHCQQHIL